jgi:iron(III) transport system ATP-binding protein
MNKTPSKLELTHLEKSFDATPVISDCNLIVNPGELVSLLGPSGCGKSTTLRLIGGFIDPDNGDILLNGRRLNHIPPERRPVSTVFQSYALFPHMSVLENVMYGLRCRRTPRSAAKKQAIRMLDTVELADHINKNVTRLSGGQQQRVALARALVLNPEVLLLDEPFSNLDAALRLQMREEVRKLQRQFGLTTLFVTHDHEEALALSDRVAVMQSGRIIQVDTPEKMYTNPCNRYVAECVGQINTVQIDGRPMCIRPEHVCLTREPGKHLAQVVSVAYQGALTRYTLSLDDSPLVADSISLLENDFQPGDTVSLQFTHTLDIGPG